MDHYLRSTEDLVVCSKEHYLNENEERRADREYKKKQNGLFRLPPIKMSSKNRDKLGAITDSSLGKHTMDHGEGDGLISSLLPSRNPSTELLTAEDGPWNSKIRLSPISFNNAPEHKTESNICMNSPVRKRDSFSTHTAARNKNLDQELRVVDPKPDKTLPRSPRRKYSAPVFLLSDDSSNTKTTPLPELRPQGHSYISPSNKGLQPRGILEFQDQLNATNTSFVPLQQSHPYTSYPEYCQVELSGDNLPPRSPRSPSKRYPIKPSSKGNSSVYGKKASMEKERLPKTKTRGSSPTSESCHFADSSRNLLDVASERIPKKILNRTNRLSLDYRESNSSERLPKPPTDVSTTLKRCPFSIQSNKQRRIKAYSIIHCETLDREMCTYEEHLTNLPVSSPRGKEMVRDFEGRDISSSRVFNEDLSEILTSLSLEKKRLEEKVTENKEEKEDKAKIEDSQTPEIFSHSLDLYFYNEFRNSRAGRRMAICEEIESALTNNDSSNAGLRWYREQMRLEEVLGNWVV